MSSEPIQLEYAPRRRSPLVELLALAGPTIAQMASYTVMQFLDTFMLSRLGVTEPTAAGNAGLFSFAVISLGFGAILCVNTLVSQHFGQRDYARCGRHLWQGIWFALLYGVLAIPVALGGTRLFNLFGHEPELARLEGAFFTITVSATVLKLLAVALGQFLLAIDRPGIVMVAAMCAVAVNAGVNMLLIYGNWGFPSWGVAGAAFGTNIGVFVEASILACIVLGPAIRRTFHTLDARFRRAEFVTLLRIGIPSGLQLVSDVLAWGIFSVWVMARFHTPAMAANNFLFRYISVSFMPAFGVASAVTALVGRYIGAGRPDIAENRAHLGFLVTGLYMLSCGAVYIIGRNELMKLFSTDEQVLRIGAVLLIFGGVYQIFDAMYIVYNGALRGAGDTLWPAIATAALCWGVTVGGGHAMASFAPGLGPAGPWIAATVYGMILGLFLLLRFKAGGWKSINLEPGGPSAKVRGFENPDATRPLEPTPDPNA